MFKDFNQVEKVATLPRRLSTDGSPAGAGPDVGDIGYWVPSGSLVFYYGDVGYWEGIVESADSTTPVELIEAKTTTSRSPSTRRSLKSVTRPMTVLDR